MGKEFEEITTVEFDDSIVIAGSSENYEYSEFDSGIIDGQFRYVLSSDGTYYSIGAANPETFSGNFNIPETYNGLPVEAILDYGFANATGLTNIYGNSSNIKIIGEGAFQYCTNLSMVDFGLDCYTNADDVGYTNNYCDLEVIESYAFKGCSNLQMFAIGPRVYIEPAYEVFKDSGLETSGVMIGVHGYPETWNGVNVHGLWLADPTGTTPEYQYGDGSSLGGLTTEDFEDFEDFETTEDFEIYEDLEFTFINYAYGDNYYSVKAKNKLISGHIEIPATYNGLQVAEIDSSAFEGCSSLTSITIPNSVTKIGVYAFTSCSGLTSVTIPDSVTKIGSWAFEGCSSLTSVTIPDGITSIEMYSFDGCTALTSATIPDSVTSIGDGAFRNCGGLTRATIGNSVTSIGYSAFAKCSSLTSVEIPDSVTSIGDNAFSDCSKLTDFTLYSTTAIPEASSVFYGCDALTEVNYIRAGVYTNGGTWNGKTLVYLGDDIEISEDLEFTLINNNCYSVKAKHELVSGHIEIPATYNGLPVVEIASRAFSYCYALTGITIPNSVTTIENHAFEACTSLASVTIPNSVTSIGWDAFWNCEALTDFTLNSTTAIPEGSDVFYGCDALIEVKYTQAGVYTNGGTWNGKTLVYSGEGIDEGIETIGDLEFTLINNNCYSVKAKNKLISGHIEIPATYNGLQVAEIDSSAFYGCTSLTSITIPNSVTSIGRDAFASCNALTSINIPGGVTTIGESAFFGCSRLTSITIGNSVTSIGEYAFCLCSGLTSVTIPASVTSIGSNAFGSCTSLTDFTLNSTTAIPEATNVLFACFDLTEVKYTQAGVYTEGNKWNGKTLVYFVVESTATTLNLLSGLAINKHVTVGDFRQS